MLVEQRKAFDEKIDELDQLAQDKLKNGRWDREDAEILRNNALRSLASVCCTHTHTHTHTHTIVLYMYNSVHMTYDCVQFKKKIRPSARMMSSSMRQSPYWTGQRKRTNKTAKLVYSTYTCTPTLAHLDAIHTSTHAHIWTHKYLNAHNIHTHINLHTHKIYHDGTFSA